MLNHSCGASTAIEIELDNSSWSPQLSKRERLHGKAGAKGQDGKAGAKVNYGKIGAKVHDGYKGGSKRRGNSKAKPKDGPWKGRELSERMEEETKIWTYSFIPREPRIRRPRDTYTMEWIEPRHGQDTKLVEAIVVHGIACTTSLEKTLRDMCFVLGDGVVVGARWLLEPSRRIKRCSSVVIYFGQAVKILSTGQRVILHGKTRSVQEYDFDKGSE